MIFLFIGMSEAAWAWPPTYGAEFELSNDAMLDAESYSSSMSKARVEDKAKLKLYQKILEKCPTYGCKATEAYGKHGTSKDITIQFADGWWFRLSHDPGVIEVMTKPATIEELRARQAVIDDLLFETARKLGLTGTPRKNGPVAGHFNFGLRSAFGDDTELFLRFFVDYANRPFLALGALGYDTLNAPPLLFLEKAAHEELEKIISEFEKKKQSKRPMSLMTLGKQILARVYKYSYDPEVRADGDHYQAFSIKKLPSMSKDKDMPGELRAIYAQNSMADFILMAELFEARLAYLKKQSGPIVLNMPTQREYSSEELVEHFKKYLDEAGLDYKRYKALLPLELRKLGPTHLRNRGRMKDHKGANSPRGLTKTSCREIFEP